MLFLSTSIEEPTARRVERWPTMARCFTTVPAPAQDLAPRRCSGADGAALLTAPHADFPRSGDWHRTASALPSGGTPPYHRERPPRDLRPFSRSSAGAAQRALCARVLPCRTTNAGVVVTTFNILPRSHRHRARNRTSTASRSSTRSFAPYPSGSPRCLPIGKAPTSSHDTRGPRVPGIYRAYAPPEVFTTAEGDGVIDESATSIARTVTTTEGQSRVLWRISSKSTAALV